MGYDLALVTEVRTALDRAGDPERAARQQSYMKSALPFHGIPSPSCAGSSTRCCGGTG